MNKPIWALDPKEMEQELNRAKRAHTERPADRPVDSLADKLDALGLPEVDGTDSDFASLDSVPAKPSSPGISFAPPTVVKSPNLQVQELNIDAGLDSAFDALTTDIDGVSTEAVHGDSEYDVEMEQEFDAAPSTRQIDASSLKKLRNQSQPLPNSGAAAAKAAALAAAKQVAVGRAATSRVPNADEVARAIIDAERNKKR